MLTGLFEFFEVQIECGLISDVFLLRLSDLSIRIEWIIDRIDDFWGGFAVALKKFSKLSYSRVERGSAIKLRVIQVQLSLQRTERGGALFESSLLRLVFWPISGPRRYFLVKILFTPLGFVENDSFLVLFLKQLMF